MILKYFALLFKIIMNFVILIGNYVKNDMAYYTATQKNVT